MKLPKDFPKFQTVAWWIEQLKEYPQNAVVIIATGPRSEPVSMLSTYHPVKENGDDDLTKLWIDVGNE